MSKFHQAVIRGETEKVGDFLRKRFLRPPANPNRPDERGNLPLHYAALPGRVELIELLLANGARVEERNAQGLTALHLAVKSGKPKAVAALLAAGANANVVGVHGDSPLHWAARYGFIDACKHLIGHGADLTAVCASTDPGLPLDPNHPEFAERWNRFSEGGGRSDDSDNTDQADLEEGTPLDLAVIHGRTKVAALLIESGAPVDLPEDSPGTTPLHHAAFHGRPEIAEILLSNGARVDADNYAFGVTPLYWAVAHGHRDVAEVLLDHGALIDGIPTPELSFEEYQTGHPVLRHSSPLEAAARGGHVDVMRLLLERGASTEAEPTGDNPLFAAVEQSHPNAVELLLECGAKTDVSNMIHKSLLDAARSALGSKKRKRKVLEIVESHLRRIDAPDTAAPKEIQREHDISSLKTLLNDEDRSDRKAIVDLLQKAKTEESLDVLIEFLRKHMHASYVNSKRSDFDLSKSDLISSVLYSISKSKHRKAIRIFIEVLEDERLCHDVLKAAIHVAGNIDDRDMIRPLQDLARHQNTTIADSAMEALSSFKKYDSSVTQTPAAWLKSLGLHQ